VAPYKKTPEEPVEPWSFSMRAALCSSRWFAVRGHLEARRQFCANGIAATGSRPSAPLRSHLVDGDLVFTGLSIPTTSAAQKSCDFFRGCGAICPRGSLSSGTAHSPIGQSRSKPGLESVAGSLSSGCRRTPRISIPWKWSGVTPSGGILRTTHQTALRILNMRSSAPCPEPKVRDRCFWPSSEALD
jgi:hypothetical protein